jgi:hypothetical protein
MTRDNPNALRLFCWANNIGGKKVPGRDTCVVCGAQLKFENNDHKCDPQVEERVERGRQSYEYRPRKRTFFDRLNEGMTLCDFDDVGELLPF